MCKYLNLYSEDNEVSLFIDGFGYSFGQILTFFINQFFKYRRNIIKKKKIPSKKYFIDYFLLKYKYYIHHIISIIAIIIISLTIDLILGNFTHINSSIVINSILYIIGDSFLYSYCKHLMKKKIL